MSRPTILTVDDDPPVSAAITRDLRARYGADYRIVRTTSGAEALDVLAELALQDRPVALVVTDQRMPRMTGIELLAQARGRTRRTPKFLLLTAYADTDVAITAINDIGLDYYLLKPWDPPEERLYPVVDDLLDDWRHEHPDHTVDVRVVGHRWSERSHEVKTFLARNHVPYRWLDVELDDEARRLAELAGRRRPTTCPLVLVPDAETLRSPTTLDLAERLGLRTRPSSRSTTCASSAAGRPGWPPRSTPRPRDCAPSWSSARRPAARPARAPRSRTTSASPRGSAAPTSPSARSPRSRRFGAELVLARDVVGFEPRGPVRAVLLGGAGEIEARAVVVATGVSYRRLEARRARRPHRPRRLLRRQRERRRPGRGRRRLRRRSRQLRRPGRARTSRATPSGW